MKKINNLYLCASLSLLFLNYYFNKASIAEIWVKFHVNSLIGFQKVIESSFISQKFNIDLWNIILRPIIEIQLFLILSLLLLIIFIIKKINSALL